MKQFLDAAFGEFNNHWDTYRPKVEGATAEFEKGVESLLEIFGEDVARKPGSRQFNRAIFDALIYFQSSSPVRIALRGKEERVKEAYRKILDGDTSFVQAIERDTAGAPNTAARLTLWAKALEKIVGTQITPPAIPVAAQPPAEKQKQRQAGKSRGKRRP
jgi:hypothetical protein